MRIRRSAARISGARLAGEAARRAGEQLRASRRRRRLTQAALGRRIGVSQASISAIEAGQAAGTALEIWFALGEALGRPFRAEFLRDGLAQPEHAPHLDMQELVLRIGRVGGYAGRFELATRPHDPARSVDVLLVDHHRRRMVLCECWNTLGDLAGAARSTDRKTAEAAQLAVARARDGDPYAVGAVWVVRDTVANRAIVNRYPHIFESRLPGSSAGWLRALTSPVPLPTAPGLVWCDVRATRLFARRARPHAGSSAHATVAPTDEGSPVRG
jgi:transcriptional regulator with XRE-family HTH domain